MVLRVGARGTVKKIERVAPDVKTTAPATQETRVSKASSPPPTPPTVKPTPPPTPTAPIQSNLEVARARIQEPTPTSSVRLQEASVRLPETSVRIEPAVRIPETQKVIQTPIPYVTPSVIYSEPVAPPPQKQGPQQPAPAPEPQKVEVPLVPGTAGFLGGISTIPLTAGAVATLLPKQPETPGTLEGYKPSTSKGGVEALDISEKVLSQTVEEEPLEYITTVTPGGEPTTRTFIDPNTGEIVTETTTPGDIIESKSVGGGQLVTSTIGMSEVTPDLSDPLGLYGGGGFYGGVKESALNELIGVKNIGAIATGKEQEAEFATPSSLVFGGIFAAGSSLASDIGTTFFDLGRQVAGKAPVPAGKSVETIGILGDKVQVTRNEIRGDAYQILEDAGLRASRIAVADPGYALGDLAVQLPLLLVAPVKAASLGLKGIGAATKAVKAVTPAGKAAKLLSATGQKVTDIKPKTSIEKSFPEEFGRAEAKMIQAERIEDYSSLSDIQRAALQKSQRGQFEKVVEELQQGKRPIGETTAEFAGQSAPGRLIPVPKETAEKQAAEFFAKQGRTDLIPEDLQRALQPQGEGLFGRLAGTAGSPPATKGAKSIERDFQDMIKLQTKLETDQPLTLKELSQLERLTAGRETRLAKATEEGPAGLIGGIRRESPKVFDDVGPPRIADDLQYIQRFGDFPSGGLSKIDPGFGGDVFSSTVIDLGRGYGKFGDDLGGVAGVGGRSGDDFFGGAGDVGRTISKSDIDDFSKKTGIPSDKVEDVVRKGENSYGSGTVMEFLETKADDVARTVANSQKLFELEKARKALKKTTASKAISSIEDQATQRKLSDLIKLEKARKPSTTADKATQAALRKLINEEKTKIATNTLVRASTKADEGLDILRAKPRKLTGIAEETGESVRIRRGVLGGAATGLAVGSALGLGLGIEQAVQPKIFQEQLIFEPTITRQVKDPTIEIQREVFGPVTTQRQKQPELQLDRMFRPPETTTIQRQPQKTTDIFTYQTPQQTTTKKQQSSIFEQTIFEQPTQITTQIPPGIPPGFGLPFEGSRADVVGEEKSQRRFFRVFDIAKTPFGRIEVGLGAQVQSDRPIFEIGDVPTTSGRKRRNIGEDFFSSDTINLIGY